MTTTEIPVRLDFDAAVPAFSRAMSHLDNAATKELDRVGIDPALRELVRIRASQLNGCAYCIDMHTKDARAAGETEERIYALNAWQETPLYSAREQAALALTEAVTLVHDGRVPDDVYRAAAEVFKEDELAAVIWAAIVINAYNRVAISTRMAPGNYRPAAR